MRTTLDLDQDVLLAVKGLATTQRKSAGKVLSELARQALRPKGGVSLHNGIRVLPKIKGGTPVTMELVNRLRDELP
jgi:hypothetical protein